MPNQNKKATYTTVGTSWTTSSNLDLDSIYRAALRGEKSNITSSKTKKDKKRKELFRCDWCGKNFEASREEVNAEENGGYYCIDNPKCKIEGKYGRSMLNKDLFELEEEVKDDDILA